MGLISRNPYTGQVMEEFEALTFEDSVPEVQKSRRAFLLWKKASVQERGGFLQAISRRLREQQRTFAETITREMGKPIGQSLAEIEKCAWLLDHFAENSAKFLQEEMVETDALRSYVTFEPLGHHPGDHAVELSFLAGFPLCRPGPHGRQCLFAEARLECALRRR